MAEPQTYEAYIEIPESARQVMLKSEKAFCGADGKWITDYRNMVVIGLAPGGIAKVWLRGQCLLSTEIIRVQATINPKGPYDGRSNGRHRQLHEESKAYIKKNAASPTTPGDLDCRAPSTASDHNTTHCNSSLIRTLAYG